MNGCELTWKLIMRLKKTIITILILFLFLAILISSNCYSRDKKITVMLINEDKDTALIEHFKTYLERYVKISKNVAHNERQLSEAVFYERYQCVIRIPKNFTYNFLNEQSTNIYRYQLTETQDTVMADMVVSKYLSILRQKQGLPLKQAIKEMDQMFSHEAAFKRIEKVNVKIEKFRILNNYLAYASFSIILSYTVYVFYHLRREGIQKHHYICPENSSAIYRQAVLMCAAVGMVLGSVMLAVGGLIIGINFRNANIQLMVLNAFNCIVYFVAVSTFAGMIVKSLKRFELVGQVIVIVFSFWSGIFVKQEYLPPKIIRVAKYIPTYVYVQINNELGKGESLKFYDYQTFFLNEGMICCVSMICVLIALIIGEKKVKIDF